MTTAREARLWPGATVVILASGPSLCQGDVDLVRDKTRVIAVNDAYRLAPWADALYAADEKWWRWHDGVPGFRGLKFSIAPKPKGWSVAQVLRNTGRTGLELDPTGLRTGYNSGYQAINLAVHLGAARIVLLGFDMQGDHFFGSHRDGSRPAFSHCLSAFPTLVEPLAAAGVEIVNATRATKLMAFPRVVLEDVCAAVAA